MGVGWGWILPGFLENCILADVKRKPQAQHGITCAQPQVTKMETCPHGGFGCPGM